MLWSPSPRVLSIFQSQIQAILVIIPPPSFTPFPILCRRRSITRPVYLRVHQFSFFFGGVFSLIKICNNIIHGFVPDQIYTEIFEKFDLSLWSYLSVYFYALTYVTGRNPNLVTRLLCSGRLASWVQPPRLRRAIKSALFKKMFTLEQ